jgi:thiamine-phosphate pyrophosphorylase
VTTDGRGATAPRVYLVTDRHATAGRPLATVVRDALAALAATHMPPWAVAVQLREKDLGGRELVALGRELRAITAECGVRLYVNDRVDVALAIGADGVHLGGGALPRAAVRTLAPALGIAASTHSVTEVAALASGPPVDFCVFGPVFPTPSKRRYGPPLGLEALHQACATGLPVVAIGGIDERNAGACVRAGASGVACIRAILSAPSPAQVLRGFFEAIEST